MKAIITAAGLGTRFAPVSKIIPKEMLPIGSKPALELIVEEARLAGVDGITIVISHQKEMIRDYFTSSSDIDFVYQEEQLGLGHAVLQARTDDDVLVLLGDALVHGCSAASEMVKISKENNFASVIGLERVPLEKTSRYGIVKCDDHDTNSSVVTIRDMIEKPSPELAPSNLAVAGRYLLKREIFELLANQAPGKNGEIQLTDAIARAARDAKFGEVKGFVYDGKRCDIGNPDGYYQALTIFRG
ncbi:MAG: NTP transferase domain-containing protein [Kiritimatiellae bacterium]|nr:NTP transferase domain-containing protein [Kiritimatiellia bacterium]